MINARISEERGSRSMTPREENYPLDLSDKLSRNPSSSSSSHGSFDKLVASPEAAGGLELANPGGGEEDEDWSKLRCGSLCTEELARKEKQKEDRRHRQNRCPDYPGFAFGSAMFGSDTTMKFGIIKNELYNIMRSQLKRVEGEVNALSSRVKEFDRKLEESEKYIREATIALAEAVELQIEESKNRSEEDEKESNLSAFDQHVLFLETQLKEARFKARQSFQILEDCNLEQRNILRSRATVGTAGTLSNETIGSGGTSGIAANMTPNHKNSSSDSVDTAGSSGLTEDMSNSAINTEITSSLSSVGTTSSSPVGSLDTSSTAAVANTGLVHTRNKTKISSPRKIMENQMFYSASAFRDIAGQPNILVPNLVSESTTCQQRNSSQLKETLIQNSTESSPRYLLTSQVASEPALNNRRDSCSHPLGLATTNSKFIESNNNNNTEIRIIGDDINANITNPVGI